MQTINFREWFLLNEAQTISQWLKSTKEFPQEYIKDVKKRVREFVNSIPNLTQQRDRIVILARKQLYF